MLIRLKVLAFSATLVFVSVSTAVGEGMPKPWWEQGAQDTQPSAPTLVEVPGVGQVDSKLLATKTALCRNKSKEPSIVPMTGNSIIDTRCSLVAFEVCMHEELGVISQSQGAKKQCSIIKGLGGDSACLQTCIKAAKLPVGGDGTVRTVDVDGVVHNYNGLTRYAVSCYEETIKNIDTADNLTNSCKKNIALQCLMNGSSSPIVNASILKERKTACKRFNKTYSGGCVACAGESLRVNYDPAIIDLDSQYCTPKLAAEKYCDMPRPQVGK